MTSKIFKNTSFLSFFAAVLAYVLAKYFADVSYLTQPNLSWYYPSLLLVKTTFLSILKMLIAPLVFFSLLGGLFSVGKIENLKSMGKISFIYYFTTTFFAVSLGLIVVFFIHPWKTANDKIDTSLLSSMDANLYQAPAKLIDSSSGSVSQILSGFAEQAFVNPFHALANNNILGIVVAALLLGLSALYVLPEKNILAELTADINKILHQFLKILIRFLPIGVFAIVFDLSLKMSSNIFEKLLAFCLVVFGATMIHALIVLPSIAKIFVKISYFDLLKKMSKPLILAFSTSSSSATLPLTMETCEQEFKISKSVSGFVLPLGATMNMDGTALFEGVAAVFLAYLFDVQLGSLQIFSIFFMAMLSSVGAPGMPSASMAAMQMVLLAAGIPLEAIGILLVVERPLDTFRTAVNVEGDMVGALVVQSLLDRKKA